VSVCAGGPRGSRSFVVESVICSKERWGICICTRLCSGNIVHLRGGMDGATTESESNARLRGSSVVNLPAKSGEQLTVSFLFRTGTLLKP
jgi:hypothetical protein